MLVLKGLVKCPGEQMVALVWTRQPIEERPGERHAPPRSRVKPCLTTITNPP